MLRTGWLLDIVEGMDTATARTIDAVLDLTIADGTSTVIDLSPLPFRAGRGQSSDNNLVLDDQRISRKCIQISLREGTFHLEDLGQRNGVLVNGELILQPTRLHSGDAITFGQVDNLRMVFRAGAAHDALPELLTRMEQTEHSKTGDRSLRNMGLLLEATALLQSSLPYEEVLGAMVDRAIEITDAERGLLHEAHGTEGDEELIPLVARRGDGTAISLSDFKPSQTAIAQALDKGKAVIELDVQAAEGALKDAQSVVDQKLRSVVAIPLHSLARLHSPSAASITGEDKLLGVLYLDSRKPTAFSSLERQILDALAVEAASIIENAQLLERERARRRIEQELSIARDIQQALLPKGTRALPFCKVCAVNNPCYQVGGDYFDLLRVSPDRLAIVLADVSGKGLPAALLTSMLQGCFAGTTFGRNPTEVINHINKFVCARTETHRYATLFFAMLDKSGKFEYVNAGHHSPLLIRGTKVTDPFAADGVPLGMLEGTEYKASTAQLEPGDGLLFFTDGVTEAVNPEGEEYGLVRLFKLVKANNRKPVEKLQEIVLNAINEFAAGTEQADDITILALRYNK